MKRILAIILLTVSISAFADPSADRRCEDTPNGCGPKAWTKEEFATVPSPGTFALVNNLWLSISEGFYGISEKS